MTKQRSNEAAPRVAALLGSFNPPHVLHLKKAEMARDKFGADKVFLVPSPLSPEKRGQKQASFPQKLEMCEILARSSPGDWLSVSDSFRSACGTYASYITAAMSTACEISAASPGAEILFVGGEDTRKKLEILSHLTSLALASFRFASQIGNGLGLSMATEMNSYFPLALRVRACTLPREQGEPSSSAIRKELESGGAPSAEILPRELLEYIKKENLYPAQTGPFTRTQHNIAEVA